MKKLELLFDPELGYGTAVVQGQQPSIDAWLTVPIIAWCHQKISPMILPDNSSGPVKGQDWIIEASLLDDQGEFVMHRVVLSKDPGSGLLTEFWMRFQR